MPLEVLQTRISKSQRSQNWNVWVSHTMEQNCYFVPIPSASLKIFWPCSKIFDLIQYFLNLIKYFCAWSKVIFYLIILHIWAWSKIFDHIQKYWTRSKNFEHIQKVIWTKVCTLKNNTNLNPIFCLVKSSKNDFIFSPALHLIIWVLILTKKF